MIIQLYSSSIFFYFFEWQNSCPYCFLVFLIFQLGNFFHDILHVSCTASNIKALRVSLNTNINCLFKYLNRRKFSLVLVHSIFNEGQQYV